MPVLDVILKPQLSIRELISFTGRSPGCFFISAVRTRLPDMRNLIRDVR